MALVREGNKAVLLVIDVQVGVLRSAWEPHRIIQNIRTAVEKARAQNAPIIWLQHEDDELVFGSPEWQIVPDLAPAKGELRIRKRFNSAFEQTELEELLAQLKATRIVLVGAATNWCIRATAFGAIERGYDTTLVEDGHTTATMEVGGCTIEAESVVRELNIAMTWLSYPGRKNSTVLAAEADFQSPDRILD